MKFLVFVIAFSCSAAFAGPPLFTQKTMKEVNGGGYCLGVHAYAKILKDGALEAEAKPTTIYHPPTPAGTAYAQLDATETRKLVFSRNVQMFGNTVLARADVELTANWVHTKALNTLAPHIKLSYAIKGKTQAGKPPAPTYCAESFGGTGGIMAKGFQLVDPEHNVVYMIPATLQFSGEFRVNKQVSLQPYRRADIMLASGNSWVSVIWDPTHQNPDNTVGAWRITRMLQLQNGSWERVNELGNPVAITTWDPREDLPPTSLTCYTPISNTETLTQLVNVSTGALGDPRLSDEWKGDTCLNPTSCPPGTTGSEDERDDEWIGSAMVILYAVTTP